MNVKKIGRMPMPQFKRCKEYKAGSEAILNIDIDKPLSKLLSHIDNLGFTRASLAYGWYDAAWFRDSSMIILGLCEATEFLRTIKNSRYEETSSAASRSLNFLWNSIGKFSNNMKKTIAADPESVQFEKLENHLPARVNRNGGYFSCIKDGIKYSDLQSDNKYIKLRQYDSVPLTLIATEKFIDTNGIDALDSSTKKIIYNNLNELVAYMLKVYKTACANAWELDDDEIHAYSVAAIYGGIRSAISISKILNIDLQDIGYLSSTISDINNFINESFVRDGILLKSVKTIKGTRIASEPKSEVDASEIFIFTVFKPKLEPSVETNTIHRIESSLFSGNVLPIRFVGDTYFSGGRWLLLGLEFARYYADIGDIGHSKNIIDYVTKKYLDNSADGALPEQELVNPASPGGDLDDWFKKNGNKLISELGWAEAEYLIAAIAYMKAVNTV